MPGLTDRDRQMLDLEVLVWARDAREAADELWVDNPLFHARMQHLHPSERAAIERVIAARDFYETA